MAMPRCRVEPGLLILIISVSFKLYASHIIYSTVVSKKKIVTCSKLFFMESLNGLGV